MLEIVVPKKRSLRSTRSRGSSNARGAIRSPHSFLQLGQQVNAARFAWACRFIRPNNAEFRGYTDTARRNLLAAICRACRTPEQRYRAEREVQQLWEGLLSCTTEEYCCNFIPEVHERILNPPTDPWQTALTELTNQVSIFLEAIEQFTRTTIFERFTERACSICLLGIAVDRLLRPFDLQVIVTLIDQALHPAPRQMNWLAVPEPQGEPVQAIESRVENLMTGEGQRSLRCPSQPVRVYTRDEHELVAAYEAVLLRWRELATQLHPQSPRTIPTADRLSTITVDEVAQLAEMWVCACNRSPRHLAAVLLDTTRTDATPGYLGVWVCEDTCHAGRTGFDDVVLPQSRIAKFLKILSRPEAETCPYADLSRHVLGRDFCDRDKGLLTQYKHRLIETIEGPLRVTVNAVRGIGYKLVDLAREHD